MKRGLVECERVEAVEQKAGAADRERPRCLEGDAVHAGIDANRAVAGVGQRAARRSSGQVGALVTHQRLLVGGGGDLAHGIDADRSVGRVHVGKDDGVGLVDVDRVDRARLHAPRLVALEAGVGRKARLLVDGINLPQPPWDEIVEVATELGVEVPQI